MELRDELLAMIATIQENLRGAYDTAPKKDLVKVHTYAIEAMLDLLENLTLALANAAENYGDNQDATELLISDAVTEHEELWHGGEWDEVAEETEELANGRRTTSS